MPTKHDELQYKITKAIEELKTLRNNTPHRRDLIKFIRNAQKQLAIYDKYQRG